MKFVFEKNLFWDTILTLQKCVLYVIDCLIVCFLLLIFSREIEGSIEHMSNLRRDKWVVEGKIRKWVCTYWPFLWPFERMAPLSLSCSISLSSAPPTKSKCVNDVTDTWIKVSHLLCRTLKLSVLMSQYLAYSLMSVYDHVS